MDIPFEPFEGLHVFRRLFELLVFLQSAHQFGARIIFVIVYDRAWQQHARLDFGQHRGHHQVFGGEFQFEVTPSGGYIPCTAG